MLLAQRRAPVVQHDAVTLDRVLEDGSQRKAVARQAVEALVLHRNNHGNHLAFRSPKAVRRRHNVFVMVAPEVHPFFAPGKGLKYVWDEAELLFELLKQRACLFGATLACCDREPRDSVHWCLSFAK